MPKNIVENVEENKGEKTSEKFLENLVPDGPPVIGEDFTDTYEPTLERHPTNEDLMKIASEVVNDASLQSKI